MIRLRQLALLLYVASFFLNAVMMPPSSDPAATMRGYECAWVALAYPIIFIGMISKGLGPLLLPSLFLAGTINLVFLAAVVALWMGHLPAFRRLRAAAIVLLPSCWGVFFCGWRPREGYFLWTLSMLVVLLSERSSIAVGSTPASRTSRVPD
jgi:hypothetical protein